MREFQTKNRFRRFIYSYPSLLIVAILTGLMVKGAVEMAHRERYSERLVRDLESQAEVLESREAELEGRLTQLKSEGGVYAELRERFNVKAEGEEMFIIIDPKRPEATAAAVKSPWYQRVWNAIIGQ